MGWNFGKAGAGAGAGAVQGKMFGWPGVAAGAVIGGVAGGVTPEMPTMKKLGIMEPEEFREYAKGQLRYEKGLAGREITRGLSARGGLQSGRLSSAMAELEGKQESIVEQQMGMYRQTFDKMKVEFAERETAENRDFYNNIIEGVMGTLGQIRGQKDRMEGIKEISSWFAKEKELMGEPGVPTEFDEEGNVIEGTTKKGWNFGAEIPEVPEIGKLEGLTPEETGLLEQLWTGKSEEEKGVIMSAIQGLSPEQRSKYLKKLLGNKVLGPAF